MIKNNNSTELKKLSSNSINKINNSLKSNNFQNYNYYMELKKLQKIDKKMHKRLERIESKIDLMLSDYEENKNTNFLIINRLENIADFLRNNYNVVIEEREVFNFNPHDD